MKKISKKLKKKTKEIFVMSKPLPPKKKERKKK
jgi:hypothetical protein